METVQRDYQPQGVTFYYIYKALAHPENNGYVTPFSLKERLMHVDEAKQTLGSRIPWICDNMDNDLKHTLGNRPNSEFIIDPEGKVVVSREWSRPEELRSDLERLVGPVTKPTTISDLQMPIRKPPQKAATGIVKRITVPGDMSPLMITARKSETPHYAKLRAEMSGDQIYLGFFLDPLYKVHWNNKAPALTFDIKTPTGVSVTPATGTSEKLEVDADADPREFLVTLDGRSSDPMLVTVKYFACDDAETFCIPVKQEYEVSFERDRDGGSRRQSGDRMAQNRGSFGRARMSEMMQRMAIMRTLDINSDGEISAEEIEAAPESLRQLDKDSNDRLSTEEIRGQGRGGFSDPRFRRPGGPSMQHFGDPRFRNFAPERNSPAGPANGSR